MSDLGIRARVEATMCRTFSKSNPDGILEARISNEDWQNLLCTLRLVITHPGCSITPVLRKAIQDTLDENYVV